MLDVENIPVTGDTDEEEVDRSQERSQSASTPRPLEVEMVFSANVLRNSKALSALREPSDHLAHCLSVLEDSDIEL